MINGYFFVTITPLSETPLLNLPPTYYRASYIKQIFAEKQMGSSIKYVRKIFRKTNISKGLEMLVFRKIFCTYLIDDPNANKVN